jgi:predicted nuclease of restriction endonuclease-like (RecB) superfamily
MPKVSEPATLPDSYQTLLCELKRRVAEARLQASLAVNRELVILYWRIGRDIWLRPQDEGWGAKMIDRRADLKKTFPEMHGFSPRNLKYMRAGDRVQSLKSSTTYGTKE